MEVQSKTASSLAANKGVLAKLLATENLTVVHNPNARTASFDTRARVLELPVWGGDMSVDLYDLLTGHEVGHALYTFEEEWIEAIKALAAKHYPKKQQRAMPRIKTVLNIVEDPRIEKLIKRRYPGLKPAFVRGYKELWDKNFFGLNAQMIAGAGFEKVPFTDRINLHFKVGAHVRVPFSPAEKVLVDMVDAAETIADAVAASDAIIAHIRETAEEQNQLEKEANEAMKQTKSEKKQKQPDPSDEEDGEGEPNSGESFEDLEKDSEEDEGESEGGDAGEDADGEESDDDAEDGEGEAGEDGEEEEENEAGNSEGDEEVCDSDEEGEGEGEDGEGEGDEPGEEDSDEESDEEGGSASKEKKLRVKVSEGGRSDDEPEAGDEDGELTAEDFEADPDELRSITEDALRQNSAALIDGNTKLLNLTAPELDLKTVVHDFKRVMADHKADIAYRLANDVPYHDEHGQYVKPFQKTIDAATKWAVDFKTSEKQNISYMLKEFEMKKAARSHARQMVAKTGRLDMNKLHSYKTSDDLFRRNIIQHRGQSHGLMFVLDFSGSMTGTIARLAKSLTSLTMFCRMTNIPFEVYLFTDALGKPGAERYGSSGRITQDKNYAKTVSDTDIVLGRQFWMRNVLSSRMNLAEFNQAVINLRLVAQQQVWCEKMGGTPLLGALMAANEMLGDFKSRNKLDNVSLVVMTDGESDQVDRTRKGAFNNTFDHVYGSGKKPSNCLATYTDKVTKRSYTEKLGGSGRAPYGSDLTAVICGMVVQSIRDRHNANTIGYYIADGDVRYTLQRILGVTTPGADYQMTFAMAQKLHDDFKDKGFVGLPNGGYDEYYVIQPRLLDSIQQSFAEVTQGATMTAKKTFASFAKFTKGREGSRQLLKSFVARMTARDRQNG